METPQRHFSWCEELGTDSPRRRSCPNNSLVCGYTVCFCGLRQVGVQCAGHVFEA